MNNERWTLRFAEALNILHKNGFSIFEMIRLCHSGLRRFDITKLLENNKNNKDNH